MEKIILAHYINVGNSSPQRVAETIQSLRKLLDMEDNEIIHYLYPVRDQETRVECLNPRLVSEEEYQNAKKILERNQSIVTKLLSEKMGL